MPLIRLLLFTLCVPFLSAGLSAPSRADLKADIIALMVQVTENRPGAEDLIDWDNFVVEAPQLKGTDIRKFYREADEKGKAEFRASFLKSFAESFKQAAHGATFADIDKGNFIITLIKREEAPILIVRSEPGTAFKLGFTRRSGKLQLQSFIVLAEPGTPSNTETRIVPAPEAPSKKGTRAEMLDILTMIREKNPDVEARIDWADFVVAGPQKESLRIINLYAVSEPHEKSEVLQAVLTTYSAFFKRTLHGASFEALDRIKNRITVIDKYDAPLLVLHSWNGGDLKLGFTRRSGILQLHKLVLPTISTLPAEQKRLFDAVAKSDTRRVIALLKASPTLAALPNLQTGQYPLNVAAERFKADIMAALVKCGAKVNQQGAEGQTPLYSAVDHGHLGATKWLLNHGANPNIATDDGDTPLHRTAYWLVADTDIIRCLLEHGADRRARNGYGDTPFDIAKGKIDTYVTDLLRPR